FDHAYNLALCLQEIAPESPVLPYFEGIKTLLNTYRALDWIPKLSRFSLVSLMLETRKLTKQFEQHHQSIWPTNRTYQPHYDIFNDNRHEQHAFLWFTEILIK
ncbi:MAG: hypothetical protein ACKO5Q_09320, partial [Microcystaceae cyanobacterium]